MSTFATGLQRIALIKLRRTILCNAVPAPRVIISNDLDLDVADCLARVHGQDQDAARSLVEYLYPMVIRIVGGHLACLDLKTGEVLWNEADPAKRRLRKGSLAFADGRIYYRTEQGAVVLIEPNRKEYLERGRFEQPDRPSSPAWAHPVIANGKLYIRDQETLLCYDIQKK